MPDDQQPSAATPEPTATESAAVESATESAVEAVLEPAPDPHPNPDPAPVPAPHVVVAPDPGYTAAGVPTFDSVREKIQTRHGTALGSVELAEETPEGRSVSEQYDARQRAAAERLKQIRESMGDSE